MQTPVRPPSRSRLPGAAAAALAVTLLAACSTLESNRWTNVFLPYRIEIVQGNVVTSEQLARAVPGLSRAQVREVLGSPLLTDMFHANRWDYVFLLNRPGMPPQVRAVVVMFEGDQLARVDAPTLPTDSEFITSIDPYRSARSAPTLALSEEQIKALPVPPQPLSAASSPGGAVRSYPPLEQPG